LPTKIFFEQYVLDDIRQTAGRTITEADIIIHAGQTGDFFPHHVDAEWCKQQPFKERIAHGTLIFSIAIGLTANIINEVSMTYGYEKLRFLQPVFIGDTIKVTITIKDKKAYKQPEYGLITELVETYNQHNKLVLTCQHILLVKKAEAS